MRLLLKTKLSNSKRDHYLATIKEKIDEYIPINSSEYEIRIEIYAK